MSDVDKTVSDAEDVELAAFFDAARADAPRVPDDLMARVLDDAMAAMPAVAQPVFDRARAGFGQGIGRTLWETIGGWPAAGGLVTAGLVGVWIGVAPPAPLQALDVNYLGGVLVASNDLGDWPSMGDAFVEDFQ